jgi:hypothetical protein
LETKKVALKKYFSDDVPKAISCVIVPNFPFLSGLVVNDCFVLDPFLLSNYFSVGEYKRGVAITGHNRIETRELTSKKYYSNTEEMSKNFLSFCVRPEPINQVMMQYDFKEFTIGMKGSVPNIIRDGVIKLPLEKMVWAHVKEIEFCLRQLFYFEKPYAKAPANKKIIEDRIDFLLPAVLGTIALLKSDRYARIRVLEIFKTVGHRGIDYLIQSFKKALQKLAGKGFLKTPDFKHQKVDHNKVEKDLLALLEQKLPKEENVSLSSFQLDHSLAPEDLRNIIEYLIDLLARLEQRKYSEQELADLYFFVAVFSALVKTEKSYERFLYPVFLNFIDALNFNFKYQNAKNFAEEVLIYSFDHQPMPILGWLCLYKCFLKQKNIYDAAYYGALFVTCVDLFPDTDEGLLTHTLYNSMLFFRDYHFSEMEEALYEVLNNLTLSEYDKQKITLSHFSSKLLDSSLEDLDIYLDNVKQYLQENLENICQYREKGALPWLSFLYNFRIFKSRGLLLHDISFIENVIIRLEKEIDPEELKKIQSQFFPIPELSKELFKEALLNTFHSIDFDDAAHELENLEPIAKNVISLSLEPLDLSSLLLTGLVINDQSLTFPKRQIKEVVPFIKKMDEEIFVRFQDYRSYMFSKLKLHVGQELIWLFEVFNRVYALHINSRLQCKLQHLSEWSVNRMNQWLNNISDFNFNDKGGDYFINDQERDYNKIIDELSFAHISLTQDVKEVFFYSSFKLSSFPLNLVNIPITSMPATHVEHQEVVKKGILERGTDFISLYLPTTNVISLEWFLDNHGPILINQKDFAIQCWIPIEDQDYALYIGYQKLAPLLEDIYSAQIITETVPSKSFESAINIFMAHGGKGMEGFRTIYTRNEEGHAIIKEAGIESLLGTGIIAVLFVCHSASLSQEVFAQKLISLSHKVLSLGYKAVIAPSWGLNPLIAPIWLEKFLSCLKHGEKISDCVLAANANVASSGFNDYHGFYAPTGWAAMHLYGNPNISFEVNIRNPNEV